MFSSRGNFLYVIVQFKEIWLSFNHTILYGKIFKIFKGYNLQKVKRISISPELNIVVFTFLLNFAWEVLQTPFFIDQSFKINTIVWYRLHCTFGDVMITLGCFWLVALIFKSRVWFLHPNKLNVFLFTAFGIIYTIFSEIKNVTIKNLWGYSDLMPVSSTCLQKYFGRNLIIPLQSS